MVDWLTDWLTTDCLTDGRTDWMTDGQIEKYIEVYFLFSGRRGSDKRNTDKESFYAENSWTLFTGEYQKTSFCSFLSYPPFVYVTLLSSSPIFSSLFSLSTRRSFSKARAGNETASECEKIRGSGRGNSFFPHPSPFLLIFLFALGPLDLHARLLDLHVWKM